VTLTVKFFVALCGTVAQFKLFFYTHVDVYQAYMKFKYLFMFTYEYISKTAVICLGEKHKVVRQN